MIIGWLFGVAFGMLLGVGVKENVDYHACLKDQKIEYCKDKYGVK